MLMNTDRKHRQITRAHTRTHTYKTPTGTNEPPPRPRAATQTSTSHLNRPPKACKLARLLQNLDLDSLLLECLCQEQPSHAATRDNDLERVLRGDLAVEAWHGIRFRGRRGGGLLMGDGVRERGRPGIIAPGIKTEAGSVRANKESGRSARGARTRCRLHDGRGGPKRSTPPPRSCRRAGQEGSNNK